MLDDKDFLSNHRVLIVEDELEIAEIIAAFFSREGALITKPGVSAFGSATCTRLMISA